MLPGHRAPVRAWLPKLRRYVTETSPKFHTPLLRFVGHRTIHRLGLKQDVTGLLVHLISRRWDLWCDRNRRLEGFFLFFYLRPRAVSSNCTLIHDDVIKWKHFPRYWLCVRGIHRSPVNSPHKGQWRGALMFSSICARINGWVNNGEAGDLRRNRAYYDVIVMLPTIPTSDYGPLVDQQYVGRWDWVTDRRRGRVQHTL